jgi:hypothetical protein
MSEACDNAGKRRSWLVKAAHEGHCRAIHEL